MRLFDTEVAGAYRVEVDKLVDERGFFARAWCRDEFAEAGILPSWVQGNVGRSRQAGTLRGLHYQRPPFEEAKLVRCTRGEVFDVAVDLRRSSPTYARWAGVVLRADDHTMVYVPPGCAHGYMTLEDGSEVFYLTSQAYSAGAVAGVRYDDPFFGITWPVPVVSISEQDRAWPPWDVAAGVEEASA